MERTPLSVVVVTDTTYLPWTATLVRSLLDVAPGEAYDLHVINDGSVDAIDRDRLASLIEGTPAHLTFHDVDPKTVDGLPVTDAFGHLVWLRLYIPELLADRQRALYLDADTLVYDSLRALFETELCGQAIGAVANVVEPALRPHVAELGLTYPGGVFNSGVLLLDLDRLRAEGASQALVRTARALQGAVHWPDQEALNILFAGRWTALHPRYNAQNSLWHWAEWAAEVFGPTALSEATTDPVIRHFEGPSVAKPWHALCLFPGAQLYRDTLARTPWAGTPLEDDTAITRLLSRLPQGQRLALYRRLLARRARRS